MTLRRFLLVAIVPLCVAVSTAAVASTQLGDPLPVENGDFEQGFVPVAAGGHDGLVGEGWIAFVTSGSPRFLAGEIHPPSNHWQVLHGLDGAYVAGIQQRLTGLRPGMRLQAEADVYLPEPVDGITKTIGLDPEGGNDPAASSVVWSDGGDGSPWQTIGVTATMAATQTTLFVRIAQPEQALPAYVLVDNVSVMSVGFEQSIYLPAVEASRSFEPDGWLYGTPGIITGVPACTSTGMRGVVRDSAGTPAAGVRVRVWSAAASGQPSFLSAPTGSDGRWEVVIDPSRPAAGRWYVAVVDPLLHPLSPVIGQVAYADVAANPETQGIPTHDNCVDGHQWLGIDFQRRNDFPDNTLVSVRFLSCLENHLDHNLRLWVITVDGQGLRDLPVRLVEADGFVDEPLTGRDPYKPPGYIDYPIFRRQSWTATVASGSSDTTPRMSSETPPVLDACSGNAWGHYSYEIVYQRRP